MRRVRLHAIGSLVLGSLLCAAPGVLHAQTGSLFGSRGPTSQPNLGGMRSNTGGGFGSTAGGLGMGAGGTTGFGASGLGTTGLGFGSTGLGTRTGTGTGFVGRNFTAPGFVGNQQVGQMGQMGQGFGRAGNFNQFGAGGFGFGQNQFGNRGQQRNNQRNQDFGGQNSQFSQQPQIVVRSQVAFPHPERAAPAIANRLDSTFERVANRSPEFANVAFQLQPGGEVTLRGTVPNESAKRLAAALVRLEPGVRVVRNELIVAAAP